MEEKDVHLPLALDPVHTVPTHLATADTVLSLGSITLSSRQFLLLLVGSCVTAALWTRTAGIVVLLPPLGVILHWTLLLLLTTCVLALTFGQAQGRSLDSWIIVVAAYLARPHLYLWGSMREHPSWPSSPSIRSWLMVPASSSAHTLRSKNEGRGRNEDEEEQTA
jgi:hypothetical protein